ncbi:MAG: hypothetical protein ABIT37_02030, partial [Luteolibacter sp.]
MAAVSLLLLGHAFLDIRDYRVVLSAIRFGFDQEPPQLLDVSRFNAREKLLLNIGDETTTELQRAKALWETDPRDAAHYSRYCGAYLSEMGKLPPDFQEQAKLIDPGNAYFPYWTAALAAKDAAKARTLSRAARAAGEAPEWDVKDEAKVDQALAILHECQDLQDHREYDLQMIREKIPLLPPDHYPQIGRNYSVLCSYNAWCERMPEHPSHPKTDTPSARWAE